MDLFRPDKQNRRFVLVYKDNARVLEDYIRSLAIFDQAIEISDFNGARFLASNDIYIFSQMWLPAKQNRELITNRRFAFLNVENLTERNRFKHIQEFIDCGARVADYSPANIAIMNEYIHNHRPEYPHKILHLPYQANPKDFAQIYNADHQYDYDIGLINAYAKPDPSSNPESLVYRRNEAWAAIQEQADLRSINILGWDAERDALTKRCKLIANIHHFDFFRIFQHIRCDRLIFSHKVVISEESLLAETLDISKCVIWQQYEHIIAAIREALENFDTLQSNVEAIRKEPIYHQRRRDLQAAIDSILEDG